MLPWLIVGYLLLRPRPQRAAAAPAKKPAPWEKPKAPSVAFMYRLPDDTYETTRLALQADPPDGPIHEMGIFSSPANALSLVTDQGWVLGWPDVRELREAPQ